MKYISYLIVLFSLINGLPLSYALSLDVEQGNLASILHIVAQEAKENVIIDPHLKQQISLHFHGLSARNIFTVLLDTQGLIKVRIQGIGYITSRNKWLEEQHVKLRLQEALIQLAPLASKLWQIHYAKVNEVANLLQGNNHSLLSSRGQLHIDLRTNKLYVADIPSRLQQIDYLIKNIDIPIQQILIETYLVSIDSNYEQTLGVKLSRFPQKTEDAKTTGNVFLIGPLANSGLLELQLAALESMGHAELISRPRLFTASQQTAVIESGEEIPYQEESSSGGTTVTFKKAVLSLKITPQIVPGNKILLQLQINQDKPSKILVHGIPAISTHQIDTRVLLKNNQTVVLGGIYETEIQRKKQEIPFLSHIPLLGLLFQQNEESHKKREILVFVTPRIVPS